MSDEKKSTYQERRSRGEIPVNFWMKPIDLYNVKLIQTELDELGHVDTDEGNDRKTRKEFTYADLFIMGMSEIGRTLGLNPVTECPAEFIKQFEKSKPKKNKKKPKAKKAQTTANESQLPLFDQQIDS